MIRWQRARFNSRMPVELSQSQIQERAIIDTDALIHTEVHTQRYTHMVIDTHPHPQDASRHTLCGRHGDASSHRSSIGNKGFISQLLGVLPEDSLQPSALCAWPHQGHISFQGRLESND